MENQVTKSEIFAIVSLLRSGNLLIFLWVQRLYIVLNQVVHVQVPDQYGRTAPQSFKPREICMYVGEQGRVRDGVRVDVNFVQCKDGGAVLPY